MSPAVAELGLGSRSIDVDGPTAQRSVVAHNKIPAEELGSGRLWQQRFPMQANVESTVRRLSRPLRRVFIPLIQSVLKYRERMSWPVRWKPERVYEMRAMTGDIVRKGSRCVARLGRLRRDGIADRCAILGDGANAGHGEFFSQARHVGGL
jgi:hypothetical protein